MERSFRRRLIQVVLLSVIGVSSIVILFTTVSYGTTYIKKERQMAETQEEIIKNALEQEMASLYQLGSMMRNDRTLQEYLEAEEDELDGAFINQVSISMINYKKLNPNIKYLTLVRYKDETIRSVGSGWRVDQEVLYKKMCEDFDEAAFTQEETEKLSVSEDIFGEPEHTMNLFFPVYSTYSLYQEIGYISLGIPEKVIREYYEGNSFDNILLMDSEGRILSHKDSSRIGSPYEHDRIVSGKSRIQYRNGTYYLDSLIDSCGWHIIAEISLLRILKNSLGVLLLSALVMCFSCASLLVYCYRAAKKLIHPVEDLEKRMGAVAEGNMAIRMDVEYQETEFNEMAKSFNVMVKNVDHLMQKIKEEQIQMRKMELSALQDQIKPHFLYNTLECIHMQAVLDGNREISRLVLALASYYRLCLSRGQDVVTLKQELKHIENYLIIQNVRYRDIIHFHQEVPKEYQEIRILKMTLQPLIENCIYHGIKVREGNTGDIFVSIRREGKCAVLSVSDNGAGMEEDEIEELNKSIQIPEAQNGYGVRNVNQRIKIYFGEEYGLLYKKNKDQGITVEVRIPYQQ